MNRRRTCRLALASLLLAALWPVAGVRAVQVAPSTPAPVESGAPQPSPVEPWQAAGLTAEQAAAHLLSRFSFGARPGEVARVAFMGPRRWFEDQLAAEAAEPRLEAALAPLASLDLSISQIVATYPSAGLVLREAMRTGALPHELTASLRGDDPEPDEQIGDGAMDDDVTMDRGTMDDVAMDDSAMDDSAMDVSAMDVSAMDVSSADSDADLDRRRLERALRTFGRQRGYLGQQRLLAELAAQKLYRALYAENQLAEVMTSFWFNHFYVSLDDTHARPYVLPYERDAIRPHALGRFDALLAATARHPAMLMYLDNANSTANPATRTTLEFALDRVPTQRGYGELFRRGRFGRMDGSHKKGGGQGGPNENYARELLELHTLGVDGGYSQQDVVEVARAFTGWTALPPGADRAQAARRIDRAQRADLGFYFEDDFLFRANAHDAESKRVLGRSLPAGRGIEDGEEVLALLADHPATARHVARKLAVRFVSDAPSDALVEQLAATFFASHGDTRALLRALYEAPDFWPAAGTSAQAATSLAVPTKIRSLTKIRPRTKIKSPFELAASALRILDAEVEDPAALLRWVEQMGEPLYDYKAPTGFPDSAQYWVNSASLLHRMSFGLALASGRIEGVRVQLAALNPEPPPASRREALERYLGLLLPGRDVSAEIARLAPLVEARAAAAERHDEGRVSLEYVGAVRFEGSVAELDAEHYLSRPRRPKRAADERSGGLEQLVGVILGSPAFQHR